MTPPVVGLAFLPTEGTPLGYRYLLHEVLGRGSMGQVHRATTRDTGEDVAIKVLRPELSDDSELVARFLQERSILTSIDDPHVVRVRDMVAEGGRLGIVSDLVKGPDLRRYLHERGTLEPAMAARLVVHVLGGLATVHGHGIVHRDVKPENVLIYVDSRGPVAMLTDFGISRLANGPSLTRLTGLIGTPEYLAPELAERAHATPASDVYATGIMLYELLCGVTPFVGGHPVAVLKAQLGEAPGRIPGIPDALWDVLVAMLAKRPADRPSAVECAASLDALVPALAGLPALLALSEPPARVDTLNERETRLNNRQRAQLEGNTSRHQDDGQRQKKTHRRNVVIAACCLCTALAMLAAIVGYLSLRPGPTTVSERFGAEVIGNTAVTRVWHLSGHTLNGVVSLTNLSGTAADVTFNEVLPKSVAKTAAAVHNIIPGSPKVIQDDPVLQFIFGQVPAKATRQVTYRATVPEGGPPAKLLARLIAEQQQAETDFNRLNNVKKLSTLTLAPQDPRLTVGQSTAFALTGTMDDGSPAPAATLVATWTSSPSGVAAVSDTGVVTAVQAGTATITAAIGAITAQAVVTVVGSTDATTSTSTGGSTVPPCCGPRPTGPPPTGTTPRTITCPDGSTRPAGSNCPTSPSTSPTITCPDGSTHPAGSTCPPTTTIPWQPLLPAGTGLSEAPVRGFALRPDGTGGYAVNGYGVMSNFGHVPTVLSSSKLPPGDVIRGLALNANSMGYMVDEFGTLYPLGGAPPATLGSTWPTDVVRGLVVRSDGHSGYILDREGVVHPFGGAPDVGDQSGHTWLHLDNARALALRSDGQSGYVVDLHGGVHPFGNAPNVVTYHYWQNLDLARGITVSPDGVSGYVLDYVGGLQEYGDAPKLNHLSGYTSGNPQFCGIAVQSDGQHGYTITTSGLVYFFQP